MKWLQGLFFLVSAFAGYLYFLGTQTGTEALVSVPDARLPASLPIQENRLAQPVFSEDRPLAEEDETGLPPLDDILREFERQVANMQPGEFDYFARHALSLEELIALRDSGHLEIQANIAVLLGNAIDFDSIPRTDVFIEHQKIAWTFGMDAYRAINFMEQNQYGRLMNWEEMREQIESPGFDSFKSSFPEDYPELSDEVRAQLYQRVLSARENPSIPAFVPLSPSEEP